MLLFLTASSDSYITNKIVDGTSRETSNVGYAGTLDLFSIHDESSVQGSHELSRILINFNLDRINQLTSSILDLNSFKANLKLKNITAGNPLPSNFTVSVHPLAKRFYEGFGYDIVSFSNAGVCSWLSASNDEAWSLPGCDDPELDYYSSLDYGGGDETTERKQFFEIGSEDLIVDVTKLVSASISGLIENSGFRISYSSSDENDGSTKFVKRFASRHSKNESIRPVLEIKFRDSKIDYRDSMIFGSSGTLRMFSFKDGKNKNLILGVNEVTGTDCMVLSLSTGSYKKTFSVSQDSIGGFLEGQYKSEVIIDEYDAGVVTGSLTLAEIISQTDSVTFKEEWISSDLSKVFYENEIKIKKQAISTSAFESPRIVTRCDGPSNLKTSTISKIRVRFFDISKNETASKFSLSQTPEKIVYAQYRLVDDQTRETIIDFDEEYTALSLDESGNYFYFDSSALSSKRSATFDFKIFYSGKEIITSDSSYILRAE